MRAATIALIFVCLTAPALAAPKGDQHGKGAPTAEGGQASVIFTASERSDILAYFQSHPATPQRLPPGIARRLARGKPLPPGIAKKMLPQDLDAALPVRSGYERVVVGADVVLVDAATQLVVDIMRNVLQR